MAKNKTIETGKSVQGFLAKIKNAQQRDDCAAIATLLAKHSGFEPKMWGPGIVGFGTVHYKYESGREGDMPLVAFSPRASAIVFYLSANFEQRDELLKKLGKHRTGGGCLYIKTLADVDPAILTRMVKNTIKHRKTGVGHT
ncbi:MAG TPA: DUF1801 domain-containing protein [Bacteroidota bacterium]|jgi:hypothetical protein